MVGLKGATSMSLSAAASMVEFVNMFKMKHLSSARMVYVLQPARGHTCGLNGDIVGESN